MERGAAEKPLAHGGPPPVPELSRRQKRRELDARRSKCRIRIGGHLERWCRLKEQLGFALHSQLAQFLLDRYSSHGSTWSSAEPERLQPAALQRLVVLSHSHGQECSFVPDIQLPTAGGAAPLVWECVAGHRFSWGGDSGDSGAGGDSGDMECGPTLGATRRRSLRRDAAGANKDGEEGMAASHQGDEEMGDGGDSGGTAPQVPPDPEPAPAAADSAVPGDDGAEPREEEEDEDFDLAYSDDLRDENYHPSLESNSEPQRRQNQPKTRKKPIKEEQPRLEPPLPGSNPLEEEIGRVSCDQDTAQIGPKRIRYSGKREKGHFQALKIFLCFILNFVGGEKKLKVGEEEKSCWGAGSDPYSRVFPTFRMIFSRFFSRQEGGKAGDPPLRLRRLRQNLLQPPVPERERPGKIQNFWSVGWGCPGAGIWELIGVFFLILIFIFPPCWQHHQKYQHVHQKTFTCSEPTCGKSFNFKKHLKEHEKLHSDQRDYICEFCARSFRTSSNLIIHRRIHTGEKPLQCEICGFTCRQKASLNWHMKKHDADSSYRFPCDVCGKKFEKRDNVAAHKSKSHAGNFGEGIRNQPEPPGNVEPPEIFGNVVGTPLEYGAGSGNAPKSGDG
ncbi:zinc finger protein 692 isoform X3 [Taeniopygia guttata]|uniref:zinc finger protein 692 isoform X3 n=1 Tax=Taeniopygia guttata TaxID=59729 RepID=UPI003BB8BDCC